MDLLITHRHVDLDAVFSLAAARNFIPGARKARIVFYPANWNGGLEGEALILDMDAGGRGMKGTKDSDGTVHSCFQSIILKYAPEEVQQALGALVKYVDLQDTSGSVIESLIPNLPFDTKEPLVATSLSMILKGLRNVLKQDDMEIFLRMEEIFLGLLHNAQSSIRAVREAEKIPILHGGRVAVVSNAKYAETISILFRKGVRVAIYINHQGIGLLRAASEPLQLDHPEIRKVVEEARELDQWFAHSAGFIYCRGTRKSPSVSSSKVDPHDLARVVARLLDGNQEARRDAAMQSIDDSLPIF